MNKLFIFLLIAISLLVSRSLGLNIDAHKNQYASISPITKSTPKPLAKIEKIQLDRNEVISQCPTWVKDIVGMDINTTGLNSVRTIVSNPKNSPLVYEYTISGGRIVGQGENVVWDLNGVRPGIYTISVSIDDGRGFSSEIKTQEVTVYECDYLPSCVCPALGVVGGGAIKAGEAVEFTAYISGDYKDVKYNWTVSQGEIIEGQGTSKIKVKTTSEMSGTIKATAEIKDNSEFCYTCSPTDSETATIIK